MMPRSILFLSLALLASPFLSTAGTAGLAEAATLTVNSESDAVDASPGNGACETATGNGICTLRAAIMEANNLADDDTIVLPAGTYTLTIAPSGADGDESGELNITANVTLSGAGQGSTAIDGSDLDQVFVIGGAATVTMEGVTVQNGTGSSSSSGGGITNFGTLTLNNCKVSDNASTTAGGGVSNIGTLMVDDVTISGNSAPAGGGIYSYSGTVTIVNSTVSGNTAEVGESTTVGGGGLMNNGTMVLTNSTVSGNISNAFGGGLSNYGTASLNNVTIKDNAADNNGGDDGNGGGIYTAPDGTTNLQNTVVADNSGSTDPDCSGALTSQGYNLVENGSSAHCSVSGDEGGNITGQDPSLGGLADNGGPTLTHAPLSGSKLIDSGNPGGCLDNEGNALVMDQRGEARPIGSACDIGAVEAAAGTAGGDAGAGAEDGTGGSGGCSLVPH